MSKIDKNPLKNPCEIPSKEKYPKSRKDSILEEPSHLNELKTKGKKVLKKLIPNRPIFLLKKLVQMGVDLTKLKHNSTLIPALTLSCVQS